MTSSALPVHVGLVDKTGKIDVADLTAAAGALNEQILRDFAPVWGVVASCGYYPKPPRGTWQVQILEKLDQPDALGYHDQANKQPIAYVELTDDWTVTASHELLEMLADPSGNRMHSAHPVVGLSHAQLEQMGVKSTTSIGYLLEACDPCEATSYEIGGVSVSDFLLPDYYLTRPKLHAAYSHAAGVTKPRQVADGGYVSFAVGEHWWQVFNQDGENSLQDLGEDTSEFASLREFTDHHARAYRAK